MDDPAFLSKMWQSGLVAYSQLGYSSLRTVGTFDGGGGFRSFGLVEVALCWAVWLGGKGLLVFQKTFI
jgi:hypothetical protein